jgi:hypothetical protein
MVSGKQIDAILLDFSKAFDKVPHTGLLMKLDHNGIRGTTLKWIQDFLIGKIYIFIVNQYIFWHFLMFLLRF